MTTLAPNLTRSYRPIMDKPPNPFADLAKAVLPEQTSGRLARLGGVDQRAAQRWIAEGAAPDDVTLLLQNQLEILDGRQARRYFQEFIADLQRHGLHDEVIGSLLSAVYEDLLQRRIR